MSRILYLDAPAGVSGDMFVGALLHVGRGFAPVRSQVAALGVEGLRLATHTVTRHGVEALSFDVLDPETGCPVDDPGAKGVAPHPRRGLADIRRLIEGAVLPDPVIRDALGVFERLARAEAKVHGTTVDEVHFHEVGALDAIADIVAGVSAFHGLGVDEAWCSPLHVGCGTVRCAHGVLPVPAPATAEILKGVPVYSDGTVGELVTPTGAALVRHLFDDFGPMPPLVVEAVGYGAGTKNFGIPNLLRASVGRACAGQQPLHAATVG